MKKEIVYAFIDSQNLNLGTLKDVYRNKKTIYKGWKLDFRKFKQYLVDKYRVSKLYIFIGYVKENKHLYKLLKSFGYTLIYKPTVMNNKGNTKGNVDAELVLYAAAIEYAHYDKAVIVSGDGDFFCLNEFLRKNNKLKAIIIPNRYSESSLLKELTKFKTFLNWEKDKLEYKP